jgi:hypothetical protein
MTDFTCEFRCEIRVNPTPMNANKRGVELSNANEFSLALVFLSGGAGGI